MICVLVRNNQCIQNSVCLQGTFKVPKALQNVSSLHYKNALQTTLLEVVEVSEADIKICKPKLENKV